MTTNPQNPTNQNHPSNYCIATLGSHSALQILKGAKDEGFKTLVICKKGREEPYQHFKVADEILTVDHFNELTRLTIQEQLKAKNAILIPHGSFISEIGVPETAALTVPYFGNKQILKWESDRDLEHQWLTQADIKMPKIFPTPDDIDRPVIVKFHGAGGGDGYFLAKTKEECKQKLQAFPGAKYQIQEYIIGVPIYIHYFHSPLTGEVELLGFDKRYETNVDGIGRIGAADQQAMGVQPSYTVVGNIPLVVRESLLPEAIKMGKQVVQRSKELAAPGLFGPFCLEGILTPNKEFIIFEISARIVAGTNPYVAGSPYTALRYNEPMSTGRRIAREIKLALEQGKMNLVLQ